MCIPNENFTELLEFCYIYTRMLIQKGTENLVAAIGIIEHCGLLKWGFNNQFYGVAKSAMSDHLQFFII